MKLQAPVHGYKIFNPDWTYRDKQYTCPGEFNEDVTPDQCSTGMHFCPDLKDCFEYYPNNPNNHCAEVVALGTVVQDGYKYATDHLKIIREISWDEVLKMVNQGKSCTGIFNSGDRNSGNYNSGNRNSGNWNSSSFSNGVFCTKEPEILIFDKPSGMTLRQWRNSDACRLLNRINFLPNIWVFESDMTDAEKERHPEYKSANGFLKVMDTSHCCVRWWESLDESDRDIIRSIPNFDVSIFKKITGIDVNK